MCDLLNSLFNLEVLIPHPPTDTCFIQICVFTKVNNYDGKHNNILVVFKSKYIISIVG